MNLTLVEISFLVQCSRTSEEQVSLPAHRGPTIVLSSGLLVDTNLDTSIPDTYRSPPAPVPYDVVLGHPQTPVGAERVTGNVSDVTGKTANSGCTEEIAAGDNTRDDSVKGEKLKLSDCKEQSDFDIEKEKLESDPLKSVEPVISAEECPTCLEGNDAFSWI